MKNHPVMPKPAKLSRLVPVRKVENMQHVAYTVLKTWFGMHGSYESFSKFDQTPYLIDREIFNASVVPMPNGFKVQFVYMGMFVRTYMNFTFSHRIRVPKDTSI